MSTRGLQNLAQLLLRWVTVGRWVMGKPPWYATNYKLRMISFHFYARQHICYSAYMPRQFHPSVHLSVTRMYCIKTAERIIEILSLSDGPIILVFCHRGSLCKSDGVTRNGGAKYKGVAEQPPSWNDGAVTLASAGLSCLVMTACQPMTVNSLESKRG